MASLAEHDGPTAFAIPGNHDWIDGLETFQRHILHKVKSKPNPLLFPVSGCFFRRSLCCRPALPNGAIMKVDAPCMRLTIRKNLIRVSMADLLAVAQGWIGGWLLPQEASYFALALPHGWWLFGLDLALVDDIDMCQTRCTCLALPCIHVDPSLRAAVACTHIALWRQPA